MVNSHLKLKGRKYFRHNRQQQVIIFIKSEETRTHTQKEGGRKGCYTVKKMFHRVDAGLFLPGGM